MISEERSSVPYARWPARMNWMLGAGGVLILGAAIGLWGRHGAAVFFDMVAAGVAYCF